MAQRLKDEVRERIVCAAEAEFARAGYVGATMKSIAAAAGVSTGNLYRYFANKDELFYSLFTEELAREFLQVLRARVSGLAALSNLEERDADARSSEADLLSFWIRHRLRVVVLLSKAQGSRYDGFSRVFVDALLTQSLAQFRADAGGARLKPVVRKTLRSIFENTVSSIVAVLRDNKSEASIREAFHAFWSYQLAGLQGLRKWVRDVHRD